MLVILDYFAIGYFLLIRIEVAFFLLEHIDAELEFFLVKLFFSMIE